MRATDPQRLGRGWATRRLPVVLQAPAAPPAPAPYPVDAATTPRRFLLRVLLSAKRYTIPGALASVVEHGGTAVVPVIIGLAIDQAVATGDAGRLWLWLVLLGLVGAARIAAARFSQQLGACAIQLAQHRLRAGLSRAVLHPSGPSTGRPDAAVVSVMTNDVARVGMLGLVVHPVGEVATILFIAVSLVVISWPLGVAVLVGAPLVVWLMGRLSAQFARANRAYQHELAAIVARASDLVAGYRIIKGIRAEAEATTRYEQASRQARDAAVRTADVLGRFLAGSGSLSSVFVVGVAAFAGWLAVQDQITVGALITAVGLAQALLPQMQFITNNAVPAAAAAVASAERVLHALRDTPTADAPGASPAGRCPGGVPIVVLAVGTHEPVEVAPGELVGMRADGRTAARIVDAAVHARPPDPTDPTATDGVRILLDGVPAAHLEPRHYRAIVTVSPHQAALFSGSVADNLRDAHRDGDPGSPEGAVGAALHAAACGDFVDAAAGGLDRQVGEAGGRLSGGQRQRIALARALASSAPVLVLHDPTTAVDSVTEATIAARLGQARRGRSTILISSSPALLAVCDRVVDLGVVDLGTGRDR